uniref:Preproalbumin PawS1 n=2 Tax=Helianthus annuus TaxID=4232 RepID=H2L0T2_HELAN|nr:preproalbumin PawS1 [Helianthus annuus]ACT34883.1 preproalbumin PawS1 [Helianthus annuus]
MAKLIILVVLAILAFVEVSVSGYKTSISTITIEDNGRCTKSIPPICFPDGLDNPRGCQIRIQQLNHCQMHLTSFDYKLRMAVENPKQQQHLSLCCNQLQEVEKQCQCEAIKQVVEQAQKQLQQGQGGQQQVQQMVKKAQMLPNQCNLQCSI